MNPLNHFGIRTQFIRSDTKSYNDLTPKEVAISQANSAKVSTPIVRGPIGGNTANPAAVLAQRLNLPYNIVTNSDGSQSGTIGTINSPKRGPVDEWQFYRDYNNPKRYKLY